MMIADVSTFGTKAETLLFLKDRIQGAQVLPLYFFTVGEWLSYPEKILINIRNNPFFQEKLVVRSSAQSEDQSDASMAGCFTSIIGICGEGVLIEAINRVIDSYSSPDMQHQILIQPCLSAVKVFGVAFSRDPNTNGPYGIINYDDVSGSTDSITAGKNNDAKCFIWHFSSPIYPNGFLREIIILLAELKNIFQSDAIDIEFAITQENVIYLLQARPLIVKQKTYFTAQQHEDNIRRIANKIILGQKRHPYLHGERTIYGVMPDWNPAEIIGVRPRPLALSLYRYVVTDSVWAYQRDNYGYNNLRSFPLLIDFEGLRKGYQRIWQND
jgi:hypothetical protein